MAGIESLKSRGGRRDGVEVVEIDSGWRLVDDGGKRDFLDLIGGVVDAAEHWWHVIHILHRRAR